MPSNSSDPPDNARTPVFCDRYDRDREVRRLWHENWTLKRIAQHLNVSLATVKNVIYQNGLARKPRSAPISGQGPVVPLQEGPPEAWRQAMLPKLEKDANAFGMTGDWKKAFIFVCLLLLKHYDDITAFADWACQVTGYPRDEIDAYIERGIRNYIIVGGQPDRDAFHGPMTDLEMGDFELLMIVGVFQGTFGRTADGRWFSAELPLHDEVTRWEDDGGCSSAAE